MRYLAFIWSVLVIALSFMPCEDANAMAPVREVPVLTQSSHGTPHSAPDDCSPFCQCSCCAGFSFYFQAVTIGVAPCTPRIVVYSLFQASRLQQRPLPIWQPPQLAWHF